jgi:hypothetical protein
MTVRSAHQALQSSAAPSHVGGRIKGTAKQVVAGLGVEVLKTRTLNAYLGRYEDACSEVEALVRLGVFADLPERSGRVPLMLGLQGTGAAEAMWLLGHLNRTLELEGDVCEFGVAQGATSALLANEIRLTSKRLWLFDSFRGLPAPTRQDVLLDDIYRLGSIDKYAGQMVEDQAQVVERLRQIGFPLARARIVAGFVDETIHQPGLPEQVCFAYVDFDFYAPITTALEYLDPRVSNGGFVLVDDYGHFSAGAQSAVDEFVASRTDRWKLSLPPAFAGRFAILEKLGGTRARTVP